MVPTAILGGGPPSYLGFPVGTTEIRVRDCITIIRQKLARVNKNPLKMTLRPPASAQNAIHANPGPKTDANFTGEEIVKH